jgi:hypothetical protein
MIFNYRLSFGLVTAISGFKQKILSSEMFNTILLCILFSFLITTYFTKKLKLLRLDEDEFIEKENQNWVS